MATKPQPIFDRPNVLVTGGAGFLGSHLCEALVEEYNVICVDNFVSGDESNIDQLLQNYHFEFIRHDITEPLDLSDVQKFGMLEKFKVRFQGIQWIFHLACPTSPGDYTKFPIETMLASSIGTKNILEIARKYKSKFLFTSSSAVYGAPLDDSPFEESYWGFTDFLGPRSCYHEGKRFAESLIVNYNRAYGLDGKIVRVFNTYGPKMKLNDGRLIPDFVMHALANKPITIHGTGSEKTTFCYVSDCIEGLVKVMKSAAFEPVNMGNPRAVTIRELAEQIIRAAGSSSTIVFDEPILSYQRQGIPSVLKARDLVGWFPVVGLEDGIQKTIEYMRGESHIQRLDSHKNS